MKTVEEKAKQDADKVTELFYIWFQARFDTGIHSPSGQEMKDGLSSFIYTALLPSYQLNEIIEKDYELDNTEVVRKYTDEGRKQAAKSTASIITAFLSCYSDRVPPKEESRSYIYLDENGKERLVLIPVSVHRLVTLLLGTSL